MSKGEFILTVVFAFGAGVWFVEAVYALKKSLANKDRWPWFEIVACVVMSGLAVSNVLKYTPCP